MPEEDHGMADRLRAARTAAGLTQHELGRLSDTGRTYIAQVEIGRITNPGAYTLYAVCAVLGLRMEDLMNVPRVERTTKGLSRRRAAERAARS